MPFEDDLVSNPKYQDLQQALATVREHVRALETALDTACSEFGGQAVWVGPTARGFAEDLNGSKARLKASAQHVLTEIEAELRSTPARVSPATAAGGTGWG